METSILFDVEGIEPEIGQPARDRLISGAPVFRTWSIEEDDEDGLYAGIWEATPGKWRVSYTEWEYFHILSGHSILTGEGAEPIHLKAGSRLVIRPGFRGTWEVVETTRKDYVIRV